MALGAEKDWFAVYQQAINRTMGRWDDGTLNCPAIRARMAVSNKMSLRERVRDAYSSAAVDPSAPHAFPVGREFAGNIGYSYDRLDRIPLASVDAFAGVSNVSVFADISPSNVILDLGCGAGMDSFIAADRVGSDGSVVGIDFSTEMLRRAQVASEQIGSRNTLFCQADAEDLPLASSSIDVAIVNGIFNLNPARASIFRELGRVVRAGGTVFAAEIILRAPLPPDAKASEANWFA